MSNESLSAVDAISVVTNVSPPLPVGSLHLSTEDGAKSAVVYFKDSLIYAISVEGYQFPFGRRVSSSGEVPEEDLEDILASVGSDVSSPELVTQVLAHQLIKQETVDAYLKENFLSCATEVLSWEKVRAEWKDEEFTDDFTVRFIEPSMLADLCAKRREVLARGCERVGTTLEGFFNAKFIMVRNVEEGEEIPNESIYLLHKADGTTSVDQAAAEMGLTRLMVTKYLYQLWESNVIQFTDLVKPEPVVEEPEPVVEPELVVEEPKPVVEPEPVVEEPEPVLEPEFVEEQVDSQTPDLIDGDEELAARMVQIMKSLRARVSTLGEEVERGEKSVEEAESQLSVDRQRLIDTQAALDALNAQVAQEENSVRRAQRALDDKRRSLSESEKRFTRLKTVLRDLVL